MKQRIVYVNFPPYINTGHIQDYLLETYDQVFIFSLNFHDLGKNTSTNTLFIYKKGKLLRTQKLVPLSGNWLIQSPSMLFLLLPIRSILILLSLIYYCRKLNREFGTIHQYFTVNAFTMWAGLVLRRFNLVERVIFWVWDYYPPYHENFIIVIMRALYWQFDKQSNACDRVVYLNNRLLRLRQDLNIVDPNKTYDIVPIGTTRIRRRNHPPARPVRLGFLGVLKKDQGLDLIFRNADVLVKRYPGITLDIVGTGPDEPHIRKKAEQSKLSVTFHGFMPMESSEITKLMKTWTIGIAPYIPTKQNVSYYGDPSKIKAYISYGIPVITTNVFEFSQDIIASGGGIVIQYTSEDLLRAVRDMVKHYAEYARSAYKLAGNYEYHRIYPRLFSSRLRARSTNTSPA